MAVAYDASMKANVRIQFVATEVVPGKAPVRKVYEPRACTGATGKELPVSEGVQDQVADLKKNTPSSLHAVDQSKLLCSSELEAAVLFGQRPDGGRTELALEATLCPEPAKGAS